MFVLLINDIDLQLKHCSILLYADDTVIFTADKNCKVIEERLNNDLNKIANWFFDNNLIINLNPISTGLFCLIVALGGGVFHPLP